MAARLLERVHHVEHARALAGAQVEDAHAAATAVLGGLAFDGTQAQRLAGANLAAHPVQGRHMAAGQVDHMDVVAHARAVRRVVVVAEHAHALKLAHGNLRHVGQQVVRDALRVLADKAALVRADGVEVAQQHDVPLVVADVQVGEHLLKHALRPAVGVRAVVLRAILGDRDELWLAVHRGAAGEHQVLHAVVARHVAQHQRAGDVVPVVLKRLLHAFAHGLEAGEVDDGVDVVLVEDGVERLAV